MHISLNPQFFGDFFYFFGFYPLDKRHFYHYYVYTNFGSLETGRAASEDTQQVGVVRR